MATTLQFSDPRLINSSRVHFSMPEKAYRRELVINISFFIYTLTGIFRCMHIAPDLLFASLANDTRLRSLVLLLRHNELCVCELTQALGVAQPHVSRHLALLRDSGLVSDRREGLWVHYRIHPNLPAWVNRVLKDVFDGVAERAPFRDDATALAKMPNRPGAPRCA